MPLTPEKYEKLKALLADPDKDFPPQERERAQAAVDEYRNDYMGRAQKPLSVEMPEQYDPAKTQAAVAQVSQEGSDAAKAEQLLGQLNPAFSLPAQVLALQPGTTHPGGDEEAKNEWLSGPLDNPAGRVVFYEPHIRTVRQELLEKPELFRALQLSVPPTPEGVMSIEEGDSTYQAYADYKWKQTGDEAAKGGKTAYRFSKAPYLGEGPNAHWLDSLGAKLKHGVSPAMEGLSAIVGGYDDAANLGLGNRGAEASGMGWGGTLPAEEEDALRAKMGMPAADRSKKTPGLIPSKDESVGGIPDDISLRERNDMIEEAHPNLHTLGQIGAMARGRWGGISGMLWDRIMGEGAKGAIKGALSGGARTAAAGAVEQTAREGVQAASSYAETGDPGTTLAGVGNRVLGATAGSVLPGVLGGGIRGLSNQLAEGVRWGDRYDGAPGRVEAHGVEPKFGKGHVAPEVVQQAELRGRKEGGRSPLTVLASDLDEPLGNVARGRVAREEQRLADTVAAHRASPEGGYTLPSGGLVRAAKEQLAELMSAIPKKGLRGVAKPHTEHPVRGVLNSNIEGVSWRAGKHSVPISVEQARAWLDDEWLRKLKLGNKPSAAANDNGGLQRQGGKLFPWAAVDPDELVWLTPRRYDSQHFDEVIEQLGKSKDPHVAQLHAAALKERASRGSGDYAKARAKHDADIGEATAEAKRIGADHPRGVRKKVEAVGKSKGQHEATPALRSAAREAGGDTPEKLRGALVAEDLGNLRNWAALGSRNPLASPWSLWGLTDKAVLKYAYPAAKGVEGVPKGGARRAAQLGSVGARKVTDSPAEERGDEREEKSAEGYRERAKEAGAGKKTLRKKRRIVRRREARSEADQ